jgi:16S rRNA (adenine1518-N6/adenine1519-N6)-dimethyltransferase
MLQSISLLYIIYLATFLADAGAFTAVTSGRHISSLTIYPSPLSIATGKRRTPAVAPFYRRYPGRPPLRGWVERNGNWEWKEDDPNYRAAQTTTTTTVTVSSGATPQLPSGTYRPKQSLGQNYLKDGNTVSKIIRAFHVDASQYLPEFSQIVELGPGAGALTDKLIETYGVDTLQVIEIDERSIAILEDKHQGLRIHHDDVLQVDYRQLCRQQDHKLVVIGNLPYYITSQILFCLADAVGFVGSATVTMQYEVALRLVAPTCTKDYGILSVVFQLYADTKLHFKIPPTVFYPKPKVDSALVGLQFCSAEVLAERMRGIDPKNLRLVVSTAFQQRRKTLRKSLQKLGNIDLAEIIETSEQVEGLPAEWPSKRPEELSPSEFVSLTKLLYGTTQAPWSDKVWRKAKHGI